MTAQAAPATPAEREKIGEAKGRLYEASDIFKILFTYIEASPQPLSSEHWTLAKEIEERVSVALEQLGAVRDH